MRSVNDHIRQPPAPTTLTMHSSLYPLHWHFVIYAASCVEGLLGDLRNGDHNQVDSVQNYSQCRKKYPQNEKLTVNRFSEEANVQPVVIDLSECENSTGQWLGKDSLGIID